MALIRMNIFKNWYGREPKREIRKDTPPKEGIALFFDVLLRQFWELCKLNLVFILFCLPVVTIPAASAAMSRIVFMMLMDRPVYVYSGFMAAFKAEWRRASLAGLIYFPVLGATVFGQYYCLNVSGNVFLYCILMLACALTLMAGFYLFPMLAMLDMGLKGIFRNAILMTFLRMPQNILALIPVALFALAVWLFLPPAIMALIMVFFSLSGLITNFCAYTGLKKYVFKDGPL